MSNEKFKKEIVMVGVRPAVVINVIFFKEGDIEFGYPEFDGFYGECKLKNDHGFNIISCYNITDGGAGSCEHNLCGIRFGENEIGENLSYCSHPEMIKRITGVTIKTPPE